MSASVPMMSSQCPYDVMKVADTGIQIHLMIVSFQCLPPLSSQCLTLG
ncbi:MAG: hypothetical protein ACEY3M_05030 [Wolbachia sp.]